MDVTITAVAQIKAYLSVTSQRISLKTAYKE